MRLYKTKRCERRRNKKQQSFLALRFEDMEKAGIVRYWLAREREESSHRRL